MTGAEAASSSNLVIGYCVIAGMRCCVLYDSRATHFFVSDACVKRLGPLVCELVVSTPTSSLVRTSSLCARCPVEVEGRRYKVNLICLPLRELEVILGMDWLFANRILIDCREKRLLFPDLEEAELISTHRVVNGVQSGAQCFIIFARMEIEEKEGTSVIPVVHEFEDVFPDEVPGSPPNREVEFTIDLVLGTGPILMDDESLFSSIPLVFVYPFDSCSVLNCSPLVCFHLLGFIGPLFLIWVNFVLFGLIFVFNYF